MSNATQFARSSNVVSRVIAGETLIVPVRRGVADLASLFSFNAVASTIWAALDKPCTADELVSAIAEAYEVSPEKAREDIQVFLDEAQTAGIIQAIAA